MKKANEPTDKTGWREVFTPYIRKKDGTIVRRTNGKVFHFWVKA